MSLIKWASKQTNTATWGAVREPTGLGPLKETLRLGKGSSGEPPSDQGSGLGPGLVQQWLFACSPAWAVSGDGQRKHSPGYRHLLGSVTLPGESSSSPEWGTCGLCWWRSLPGLLNFEQKFLLMVVDFLLIKFFCVWFMWPILLQVRELVSIYWAV